MAPQQYDPGLIRTKTIKTALEPRAGYVYSPALNAWVPALAADEILTSVHFGDSASVDAFGRQRVSSPQSLFDGQFPYSIGSLLWFTKTSGGTVTHLATRSAVRLRVAAGQSAIHQTKRYFHYQAGKSQLLQITGDFPTLAGSIGRVGPYDDSDGLYFQVADGQPAFVLRSSVSGGVINQVFLQGGWNLDRLNGADESGITLDMTKVQNVVFDLQWLGVGRVRFGFDLGGMKVYVHEYNHANEGDETPYMRTASLPVRLEVIGGAGMVGNADLDVQCAAVISEGGAEDIQGVPFHAHKLTATSVGATLVPIVSIRPKALFNSLINRVRIATKRADAMNAGNNNAHFHLIYGGTLTGPVWADVDATYSAVERDISATAITGGLLIDGFFAGGAQVGRAQSGEFAINEVLPLALDIDGNHPSIPLTDSLTLAALALTLTTDIFGMLSWSEQR